MRLDAGVSLRQLAREIGVSSAYLSRVENGHDPAPTADRLLSIAEALKLPRSLLLELSGQMNTALSGYLERVPTAQSLLFEIARRQLGPAQIARIQAFVEQEFPLDSQPTVPQVSALLDESRILLGLQCQDPEDLISAAVARLPQAARLGKAQIVEKILQREALAKSYLGKGFFLPHVRLENFPPSAVFVLLARPLPVPSPDRVPLQAALLLVGELRCSKHLHLLSRAVRFAHSSLLSELQQTTSSRQALELLRNWEALH